MRYCERFYSKWVNYLPTNYWSKYEELLIYHQIVQLCTLLRTIPPKMSHPNYNRFNCISIIFKIFDHTYMNESLWLIFIECVFFYEPSIWRWIICKQSFTWNWIIRDRFNQISIIRERFDKIWMNRSRTICKMWVNHSRPILNWKWYVSYVKSVTGTESSIGFGFSTFRYWYLNWFLSDLVLVSVSVLNTFYRFFAVLVRILVSVTDRLRNCENRKRRKENRKNCGKTM